MICIVFKQLLPTLSLIPQLSFVNLLDPSRITAFIMISLNQMKKAAICDSGERFCFAPLEILAKHCLRAANSNF